MLDPVLAAARDGSSSTELSAVAARAAASETGFVPAFEWSPPGACEPCVWNAGTRARVAAALALAAAASDGDSD